MKCEGCFQQGGWRRGGDWRLVNEAGSVDPAPWLRADYLAGAVVAGLVWLGVTVALDVLVWFLGTPLGEWIVEVGARNLVLPIFGATTGYVAARVGPTGGRGAS